MENILLKANPHQDVTIQLALVYARENNIEEEVQVFTGDEMDNDGVKIMIVDDENNVIILTQNEEYLLLTLEK